MQIEFDKAKEQFLKGEFKEVMSKSKKKSGGGNEGGNSSPCSPVSESI